MKLLSVNVGRPREITYRDRRDREKTTTTAIFKQPASGRLRLGATNLDGDGQADLVGHGGPDKAVYVYARENYEFWERELDRSDFTPGQFGENFTVAGMRDDAVHIGDSFRIGGALVQVTQPRVPCFKLAIRMDIQRFETRFAESCRVGFYLRVLEEGEVGQGDDIERVGTDQEAISVRAMMHLLYYEPENLAGAEQALRIAALSPGWRESFEGRLAAAC